MKHTIETMMRQLATNPHGITAKKFKHKLASKMTPSQVVIMHMIYNGDPVNNGKYDSSRGILLDKGYIFSKDSGYFGSNHRPLKDYVFTKLGQETHDDILAKYTPIARKLDQIQTLVDTLQTQGNRAIDDEQGKPTPIRNLLALYVSHLPNYGLTMQDAEVFIKVKQQQKETV